MGISKKKSRVNHKSNNKPPNVGEEQLPIPWYKILFIKLEYHISKKMYMCRKISLLLVFLAIVVILLFQAENHADIIEATKAQNNKQDIYDPESPLPPSMSKVYIFKNAAISSDSQVCSDSAR